MNEDMSKDPSTLKRAAQRSFEVIMASMPIFPLMSARSMDVTAETSDEELDRFLFGDF